MTTRCDKCGRKTNNLVKLQGESSQYVFGTSTVKRICPACFKQAERIVNIMGGNSLEDEKEQEEDLKTVLEEMQETIRLKNSKAETKRKLAKFRKLNKGKKVLNKKVKKVLGNKPSRVVEKQGIVSENKPYSKTTRLGNIKEKVKMKCNCGEEMKWNPYSDLWVCPKCSRWNEKQ